MMFEKPEKSDFLAQIKDFGSHFADSALFRPLKAAGELSGARLPQIQISGSEANSAGGKLGESLGDAALIAGSYLLARGAFRSVAAFAGRSLLADGAAGLESGLKPFLKPGSGLALATQSGSLEAKSINEFIKRPIPAFEMPRGPLEVNSPVSAAALKQSQAYVEKGLIEERLEDGARLAVTTGSRGFNSSGAAIDSSERFILVDRNNDRFLKSVLEDARERYAGSALQPRTAEDLRNYVGALMNRFNLDAEALAGAYEDSLRRSAGQVPLGLFISRGNGVCLPRSALLKTIGDDLGFQVRMREGLVGINNLRPHVWTDIKFGDKYQIYDASLPPNPALRYLSEKH